MAIADQQRHQMIERAVRPLPQEHADASVVRWESLAAELTGIIGERGFSSLYSRTLNQAAVRFAWLAPHPPMALSDAFRLLASRLTTRAPHARPVARRDIA
ncbi:hypothetical protein [Massilia psychrophila]|jgi:hypothetical protein|uniref:Uncharacterized protein n=1 Tax=Massilia psychrophila TaxID=1603353 RepID=A0A2G8T1D1_9BURK|nr:hypothetical protein [Massilia psychrophila]PIL39508.1 hypothetical protein CR103_12185 [Massilia psychrophila]GGE79481.1 hypothetical protein GCM10008020_25350 [Massilia psychrophila]